jgi:tetratricopeptide (TPR) repeat protein
MTPTKTPTKDNQAHTGSAKTPDENLPSASEINRAAFGSDAKAQTPSMGYGNTSKVAVGTYAFHREKGDSYAAASRWKDAADEYKTALELSPNDTEVRALMAEAMSHAGQGEASAQQFAKAKQIDPNDPAVYYKQGNAYRDEQKPDLAIGSYRKSISLDPNNKFAHNNLGVVYMEQGDYSRAVSEFKKVVEIDPSYDKAILNLGIIYDDHLADKAEALKWYELYIKKGGDRTAEVTKWADAIRNGAKPK